MNTHVLLMLLIATFTNECLATSLCDQSIFTKKEINDWIPTKKPISDLSRLESIDLINQIKSKARQIPLSGNRPCLPTSARCSGSDQFWRYETILITDAFNNILGGNAEKSSLGYLQFEDQSRVSHRIHEGYTCSWSTDRVRCIKWCSHHMEDPTNNG